MRALSGRVLVLVTSILLISCGIVPRDNAGTLDRVRSGVVRAGAAHFPPWVIVQGGHVTGVEAELIERWADGVNARVTWRLGTEAQLVEALHQRALDVAAAGFTADTPYRGRIALTRPYAETEDEDGSVRQHVLAVAPGESAFLLALDRFLALPRQPSLRRVEHQPTSGQWRQ